MLRAAEGRWPGPLLALQEYHHRVFGIVGVWYWGWCHSLATFNLPHYRAVWGTGCWWGMRAEGNTSPWREAGTSKKSWL